MQKLQKFKSLAITCLFTSFAITSTTVVAQAQEIELIDLATVQPIMINNGNVQGVKQVQQLILNAAATQSSYQVNEPIRFNITTNQQAYIYILSAQPDGSTVMVYPNQVDRNNYQNAHVQQIVPSDNAFSASLFSDRVGQESFTIISSVQPLEIADLFNVVKSGRMMASTDDVQRLLADYGIDIGNQSYAYSPNIATQKINVTITNGVVKVERPESILARAMPSVVAKTRHGNTLLLSTDKNGYQINETVTVTYAATGRNYINVGIRLQDGSIRALKTQRNNSRLKQLQFVMPVQLDSVMLWESESRSTNTLPTAAESVYLDIVGN